MDCLYTVLDHFDQTAARLPDKIAVADVDRALTFGELQALARRFATTIAGYIRPRQGVAFYLEKGADVLAAMLGCVYAGGFYSLLDVRQPPTRIVSICEALQPGVVVTDEANASAADEIFAQTPWQVVRIEDLASEQEDARLLGSIRAQMTDADPLYVNFTSGSTGTPKGVVVGHRSVVDFILTFTRTFGIDEGHVLGNQAPFDFDVSVKDIYSCLFTGATLQIIPRQYFSEPTKLMDLLCDRGVTTLVWAVSALCFVSIMNGLDYRCPETVRLVMFSGEVMPPKQLRVWQKHLPGARYVNLYGPTEITCNCTYHVVDREYANDEVIPMGRPFANERVFLLGEDGGLVVEAGCSGEVCVAGTALGLGYLGDPDRTALSFVQNPLNDRWIDPVYRTGDLAFYNDEGDLVYIGRKDRQVKHMGQRIELGDIEAAAQAVEGIEQACCLYDAKRKKLVLLYCGSADKSQVAADLHDALPSYMVPGKTIQLDELPLNKNGKIDRKALATVAGIESV